MPVTQKTKATRGVPRKIRNGARKNRHAKYWDRATCHSCGVTFRSPKRNRLHKASGHHLMFAQRRAHLGAVAMRMEEIAAGKGGR